MTLLLRRRPREVYRVFTEEEYLNGAGSGVAGIGDEWSLGESAVVGEWPLAEAPLAESLLADFPPGEPPLPVETVRQGAGRERRLHRMAGVAMLAGVVGAVGGVVILNLARAHTGTGAGGSLVVAAARSSRVAHLPVLDDAQPRVTSSRPVVVRAVDTKRLRVPPIRRSLGGSVTRRSKRFPPHLPVRRRTGVAVVADYVPPQSSAEVSAVAPPAQVSTTTASVAPAPQRPAPEARPEFGFER